MSRCALRRWLFRWLPTNPSRLAAHALVCVAALLAVGSLASASFAATGTTQRPSPVDLDALTPQERQVHYGTAAEQPGDQIDAGFAMFTTASGSTGEKPQSKLWHHDGAYWGILRGPDGVAFYEKQGSNWVRGTFANAVLTSSGKADVKWSGSRLYVLIYSSTTCRVFEYTYNPSARSWVLVSGFPVTVPNPSDSETMVLESDSSGRLWTVARGGGSINVYWSTSADHKTWTSSPLVLESGVNDDDICSIVAFGGDKVGVFWSDQNRNEFGFRYHNDSDEPTSWSSKEIADSGTGHVDDHVNMAFDTIGRVFVITKDHFERMRVHRRNTNGSWTTVTDVVGNDGTRGIIMLSEADSKLYILYTRWGVTPERIEYRTADINTMSFGNTETFITASGSSNANNVTGMKQILPPGSLVACAEGGGVCYYNSFGNPPAGNPEPPAAPTNLVATLLPGPQAGLTWLPPSGSVDGYNVFRQLNGGSFTQLNGSLVASPSYTDTSLPLGNLCYQVRAVYASLQGGASNTSCVDQSAPTPPDPPTNLAATLVDSGDTQSMLSMNFDEGSGQVATDGSGNGHDGRLGTTTGTDTSDPIWTTGVAGGALQFDGSNDFVEVADSPGLDPAGSFTIEMWALKKSGTRALVSKGNSGTRTFRVRITSSGQVEFLWERPTGTDQQVVAAGAIPDRLWHHIACVYDQAAGQNRIYVDGTLRASAAASGTPATNNATMLIGAYLNGGSPASFMNGAIDLLRIWPSAIYSGNFTPPVSSVSTGVSKSTWLPGDPVIEALRVNLSWQAPASGTPAAGYNIYRSVDGGTAGKLNTSLVAVTQYSDLAPVQGQLCYTVKAVSAEALEGNASNQSCVTVGTPEPPPAAPTNLTATLEAGPQVGLAWTAPTGTIDGYDVYRQVNGGSFAKLNSSLVGTTSYTDTAPPDGNDCYRVRAVRGASQSDPSNTSCVEVTAPPPPAPGAPQNPNVQIDTTPGGPVVGAAAWALDEASGDTIADATGHGHTGQLGSTAGPGAADPAWTASGVGGSPGLHFDGGDDRCIVPDAAELSFASSFTIEAWAKRDVLADAHCLVSKGDSQRRNYWVVLDGSDRIDFRWETASGFNRGVLSGAIMTDTNWHHVACVYDQAATQSRIYLDGTLVASGTGTGIPVTNTDPLYIGTRLSSGTPVNFLHGSIDLVRVSPGALYSANFTPVTSFGGGPQQTTAHVTWDPPTSGSTPVGYNVYRQIDGGSFTQMNATLVSQTSYADVNPPAGALCYQITAVDAVPQEGPPSATACASQSIASLVVRKSATTAARLDAGPNPFNPTTTISFALPSAGPVHVAIYDVRGQRVATLANGEYEAGAHRVVWHGRDAHGAHVASGTYFVKLESGMTHLRRRLVLLK